MSFDSHGAISLIKNMAKVVAENEEYLNELDSGIGDAEHGLNLKRGFDAVMGRIESLEGKPPHEVIKEVGTTLASAGCGTGPTFYGLAMRSAARVLAKKGTDSPEAIAESLEAALRAIKEKGGAEVGSKTMVDALEPAVTAFKKRAEVGGSVLEAFDDAVEAARSGMEATRNMIGKKGRGYHAGERGLGHQDPGATSTYLLLKCIRDTVAELCPSKTN